MFAPITLKGKLFKQYLHLFKHPFKIRIQNLIGKYFFINGLTLRNENNIHFTISANDWITRIFLLEGNYEILSVELAKHILSKGGLFIDIGANFGLYTCMVAVSNEKTTVLAIEPNFIILNALTKNIAQNNIHNRVRILNTAVYDDFQFVTLEQPHANNIGTTAIKEDNEGQLSILSCSLEFICKQNAITEIELIKIDIEGNEFKVFEHFPFAKYNVKNIILEFNHLSKISFNNLISFFDVKGYDSFQVDGKKIKSSDDIPENNIWFSKRVLTKYINSN